MELHGELQGRFLALLEGKLLPRVEKATGVQFPRPLRVRVRSDQNWYDFAHDYFADADDTYGQFAKTIYLVRKETSVVDFNPFLVAMLLKDLERAEERADERPARKRALQVAVMGHLPPVLMAHLRGAELPHWRERLQELKGSHPIALLDHLPIACSNLLIEHTLRQEGAHLSDPKRWRLFHVTRRTLMAEETCRAWLVGTAGRDNPSGWIEQLKKPLPGFDALFEGSEKGRELLR